MPALRFRLGLIAVTLLHIILLRLATILSRMGLVFFSLVRIKRISLYSVKVKGSNLLASVISVPQDIDIRQGSYSH
jgi:hypothetical protein